MNILMVVTSTGSPSADNTFLHDRLVTAGHTVTYIASTTTPTLTGVDLVIIHGTSDTNVGTKYDATTVPVLGIANLPHSQYFGGGSGAAATASNSLFVAANGDPTVGALTGTIAVSTAATPTAPSYHVNTQLGAGGVLAVAPTSGTATRAVLSRCPSGGLLGNGTTSAPSRRLCYTGPSSFVDYNTNGLALLDNSVTWTSTPALSASAGSNSTVAVRSTVTLSASASAGTAPYTYAWTHISGPSTTGSLSSTTAQAPTYTAPNSASTPDVWQVTVTDSVAATATAQVTKSYSNSAPTANAGSNQTVAAGATVTIGGTDTDAEGGTLTVAWSQTSGPTVTFASTTAATTTFTAPASVSDQTIVLLKTVTDSGGVSGTASVTITVAAAAFFYRMTGGGLVRQKIWRRGASVSVWP